MLQTKIQDGIAEILLDSPPVNGITDELLAALMAALRKAGDDANVRAIVLGSALPGRFCAGLDLRQYRRLAPPQVHAIVGKLYYQLHELQSSLPKPVIAAIAGSVRGGGMSISITCDMIVAAEDATFGYPEMDVGLLPSIHYHHLHRIVGRYRAFDLLFTGRVFSAQEAMALGLVSRLAPADQVLDKARELARTLAAKSPELMRLGKAAFTRAIDNGYRQGAGAAVDLICTVFGTAASAEGLAAFDEKRKPRWDGV
jgi:enoyl-CoA hydratase/carnithine racemase